MVKRRLMIRKPDHSAATVKANGKERAYIATGGAIEKNNEIKTMTDSERNDEKCTDIIRGGQEECVRNIRV
jgi:hypothetical protein